LKVAKITVDTRKSIPLELKYRRTPREKLILIKIVTLEKQYFEVKLIVIGKLVE